jgi:serine/threonine protein kinase/tetratricopeptide (TPR) repeat protein
MAVGRPGGQPGAERAGTDGQAEGPATAATVRGTATGVTAAAKPTSGAPRSDRGLPFTQLRRVAGQRYELIKELGRGGFGTVWEARDCQTDRPCCLKFLWPEHAHGFTLVRFKREFRTARRLRHPNCIGSYDYGERAGVHFFSMELASGASLRETKRLRGDTHRVAQIALQILAALDYVHDKAIVHRDIKPHNILVDHSAGSPVARLTDFGIAKVGDLDDDARVRVLRGSAPYLAPEMLIDDVSDVRADLYALGVSLYEVLSGVHPLGRGGSIGAWLTMIRHNRPTPLAEAAPHVPEAMVDVVMRLMAKDPADRYRTAAQAYDDIRAWLDTQDRPFELPAAPPLTGSPYLAAPRLVGRRQEQDQLRDFLAKNLSADSRADRVHAPPLLFLSGPAGVGKSRLLSWLLGAADNTGATSLIGQCRSEIGTPFEGMARILTALQPASDSTATTSPRSATVSRTEGTLTTASVEFAGPISEPSEVGSAVGSKSLSPATAGHGLRQLLHGHTERLMSALAQRALLIVVEDLQWSDHETLELIKLWARTIAADRQEGRHLPVALVVTHRPVTDGSDLASMRRRLVAQGCAVSVELDQLGAEVATDLSAELLAHPVEPRLANACQVLFSSGPVTPLYVTQVWRLLLGRGLLTMPNQRWDGTWRLAKIDGAAQVMLPATVEEAVGEQASRLSVDTKALLSVAAVMGRRFAFEPLQRASGVDEQLARDCLEEAARAGFLSETAAYGWVFSHDRFREALYGQLATGQRQTLHGQVAEALRARSRRGGRDVAADLAHHYHRAARPDGTYQFGILAGQRALHKKQYSRASEFYAWAVAAADSSARPVPRRILSRLAEAAALAVHTDRAKDAYLRLYEHEVNTTRRVQIMTRLGELFDRARQAKEALTYYHRALDIGLPRWLRWAPTALPVILTYWLVMWFGPPRWAIALGRLLTFQLSPHRLRALRECGAEASITAAIHGEAVAVVRFGTWNVTAGLQLPGTSAFSLACGGMQLLFGIRGNARKAQRWRELGEPPDWSSWTDKERIYFHIQRGSAALNLAYTEEYLAELEQAFALANKLKDPRYIDMAGMVLTSAAIMSSQVERGIEVARQMHRFATSEGLDALRARAAVSQWGCTVAAGDAAGSRSAEQSYRACAPYLDESDGLARALGRCYRVSHLLLQGDDPMTVAEQACELLADLERDRAHVAVISLRATAFCTAIRACSRLEQVPRPMRSTLARTRWRVRWKDGRSRCQQSLWLGAYALYDGWRGQHRKAERELERAFALFREHPNQYSWLHVCRAGLVIFAPDSGLYRRCLAELAFLAEADPLAQRLLDQYNRAAQHRAVA